MPYLASKCQAVYVKEWKDTHAHYLLLDFASEASSLIYLSVYYGPSSLLCVDFVYIVLCRITVLVCVFCT